MSSICVHGLGYIGLPTAAMFANFDHKVYGYDADDDVVDELSNGGIHIEEPGLRAFVTQAIESGNLEIVDEVVEAKYHVICVPTPFDEETKEADTSYVEAAGEAVVPNLREGDTVILESTVPPGTTVDVLQPILAESGLDAGDDFALVHCPETVLPGNIITELKENNRVLGGVNGLSTESAVRLYDSFVEGEIRTTSDPTTAEFVKLIQNTFRDTNIALANEIAKIAADYGIESREAIDMANQHPRVDILQPGPGVGGHCLPIDPWFLESGSDELDLIETARNVNDGMSEYIIEILQSAVDDFEEAKIALLGVAYKGDVGDTRMSPGLKLAREIQHTPEAPLAADGGRELDHGPEVAIHDPHVQDSTLDLQSLEEVTSDADALVIATDHSEYEDLPVSDIGDRMATPFVVDTKGMLDREAWSEEGFTFRRI